MEAVAHTAAAARMRVAAHMEVGGEELRNPVRHIPVVEEDPEDRPIVDRGVVVHRSRKRVEVVDRNPSNGVRVCALEHHTLQSFPAANRKGWCIHKLHL
jgi:hypothetical protein